MLTPTDLEKIRESALENALKLKEFIPGHFVSETFERTMGSFEGYSLNLYNFHSSLKVDYWRCRELDLVARTDDVTDEIKFSVEDNDRNYWEPKFLETKNFDEFYKFIEENIIDLCVSMEKNSIDNNGGSYYIDEEGPKWNHFYQYEV